MINNARYIGITSVTSSKLNVRETSKSISLTSLLLVACASNISLYVSFLKRLSCAKIKKTRQNRVTKRIDRTLVWLCRVVTFLVFVFVPANSLGANAGYREPCYTYIIAHLKNFVNKKSLLLLK